MPNPNTIRPLSTPSEWALYSLMEDISQEAQFASWLIGLEYRLWKIADSGDAHDPAFRLTDAQISDLREMRTTCDGWICWPDHASEAQYIATEDWIARYKAWQAQQNAEGSL
jgi:hypothetical protein